MIARKSIATPIERRELLGEKSSLKKDDFLLYGKGNVGQRLIRLGVSSYTFSDFEGNSSLESRSYSIEDMFRIGNKMHVDGMEVDSLLIKDHFDEVKSSSENFGVKILGGCDGIIAYGGTKNVREFANLCVNIRALGGKYVSSMIEGTLSTGRGIAEVMARKNIAEACKIEYFLETHRHTLTENPDVARLVADTIPDLKFNGDLSHWIIQRYMPEEISWIFPKIKHMHVRIASEDNVQIEVGDGKSREVKIFIEGLIKPVLRKRFSGILIAELIPQLLSNQRYYPVDDTFNLLRELRKLVL